MNAETVPAESLRVGDRIRYRDLDVTVIGSQEPLENQFGLPWFKYRVEADDGRRGYARFGPDGSAQRHKKTGEASS